MKHWIFLVGLTFSYSLVYGLGNIDSLSTRDRRMIAIMRQLGHEMLVQSQDYTSRVMPVQKENNRFILTMENDFTFDPGLMVYVADSLLKSLAYEGNYLVEAASCQSGEIVYSYELSKQKSSGDAPCGGRILPKDCYVLSLTLLPDSLDLNFFPFTKSNIPEDSKLTHQSWQKALWLTPAVFLLLGIFLYKRKRQNDAPAPSNETTLGALSFDSANLLLKHEKATIELSQKEAEVLGLLLASANQTIDRETMLRQVWGNEGDYIGRTLDVFISKLRKKLEVDDSVKIVNVRGVGYKLVLNN